MHDFLVHIKDTIDCAYTKDIFLRILICPLKGKGFSVLLKHACAVFGQVSIHGSAGVYVFIFFIAQFIEFAMYIKSDLYFCNYSEIFWLVLHSKTKLT